MVLRVGKQLVETQPLCPLLWIVVERLDPVVDSVARLLVERALCLLEDLGVGRATLLGVSWIPTTQPEAQTPATKRVRRAVAAPQQRAPYAWAGDLTWRSVPSRTEARTVHQDHPAVQRRPQLHCRVQHRRSAQSQATLVRQRAAQVGWGVSGRLAIVELAASGGGALLFSTLPDSPGCAALDV